jgi:acyl-CoA thioesterase
MNTAREQDPTASLQQRCRVSPNWMRIKSPVSASADDRLIHLLGLPYVSDVFITDAAPRLSNIALGFAEIPGADLKPDFNVMLTLNSSIHIHHPQGWRCGKWFYVENECPSAAEDGRFLVNSNIFTRDGRLVASTREEV